MECCFQEYYKILCFCTPSRFYHADGHKAQFQSYGKTMIIDPWGNVVAAASDTECSVITEIDLDYIKKVRNIVPSIQNRREDVYSVGLTEPMTK